MVHQNLASGNRKYKLPGMVAHHLMHNYLSYDCMATFTPCSKRVQLPLELMFTVYIYHWLQQRPFYSVQWHTFADGYSVWIPCGAFCSCSLVNVNLCDLLFWMINFQKACLAVINSSPCRILYISEELLFCFFSFLSQCILTVFMYSVSIKPQIRKSFTNKE